MVNFQEYYKGYDLTKVPKEHQDNTYKLLIQISILLTRFGELRGINSGYRSMEHHLAIYAQKNADRAKQGLSPLVIPMASKHLIGAAVDLEDRDGKFKAWVLKNIGVLEELGIYCERFSDCPTWLHVQILSPKSGNRIFIP